MSKGSKQRPMTISNEEFKRQWDEIFGKKNGSASKGTLTRKTEKKNDTNK